MTMRWRTAAAVVLSVLVAGSPTISPAAQAITAEGLKALQTHLKTDSESWAKGELGDKEVRDTAIKLKRVTYDAKSASALIPLIRSVTGRSKPQDLYVANRLLRPLLMAKKDAVRKVMSTVKQIHRGAHYKPMPSYLQKVDKMAAPTGKSTSDAVVAAIAASQRGAGERQQKIREIKLWNEEVHAFKLIVYELIIFAEDAKEDRELLVMLKAGETAQLYAFIDICETVKKHVRSLDRARAQAYHKGFASLGAQLRAKKGRYMRHFEFRVMGNKLQPFWEDDYPGIRLLKTTNLLAPQAGRSAVVVPTPQQIEAYLKGRR